jgi:hypothetical protein
VVAYGIGVIGVAEYTNVDGGGTYDVVEVISSPGASSGAAKFTVTDSFRLEISELCKLQKTTYPTSGMLPLLSYRSEYETDRSGS